MPRVETFFEKIGRMLYLLPIARAIIETEWTRDQARPLFERMHEKQHPVTVAALERMLIKAGL
jgi:hypothetical protein